MQGGTISDNRSETMMRITGQKGFMRRIVDGKST
jgi:hypothetical protein